MKKGHVQVALAGVGGPLVARRLIHARRGGAVGQAVTRLPGPQLTLPFLDRLAYPPLRHADPDAPVLPAAAAAAHPATVRPPPYRPTVRPPAAPGRLTSHGQG